MDGTNTSKISGLVDHAIEDSANQNAEMIADKIVGSEKALVLAWARERLVLLIRARLKAARRKAGAPHPYQMFLEGFRDLSVSLSLKAGARLPLATATISILRKELKTHKPAPGAKAHRLMALIDRMKPYSEIRRGLTVQRYCELRAAGVTVEEFKRSGEAGKD